MSAQHTSTATKAPLTIPGTGIQKAERLFVGTVFRGQPLSIQRRSASGRWVRVVSDARDEGWLRASALRRLAVPPDHPGG